MEWLSRLLDLIYPPRCVHCGARGDLLCQTCRSQCQPLEPARQPRALPPAASLDHAAGAYPFEGAVRAAIHAFKYQNQRRLAEPLARLLPAAPEWRPDALVPVPLHPERERERGYNQAELLARALGQRWGLPVAGGLRRTRATAHQVGQGASERADNMRAAFAWQGRPLGAAPPAKLLLIDDVLTTGATLLACAEALRQAGAREVRGLALARAGA